MSKITFSTILLVEVNMINNMATVLSLVIAIVSLFFGLLQYRLRKNESRTILLAELNNQFSTSPDIMKFFRMIDYNEKWYDRAFLNSPLENIADKTLLYYEHILRHRDEKTLEEKDFKSNFKYQIDKVVSNYDAQCYFFNLYHYSNKARIPFPYQRLVDYGQKEKYIDPVVFNNKDSKTFIQYLNF